MEKAAARPPFFSFPALKGTIGAQDAHADEQRRPDSGPQGQRPRRSVPYIKRCRRIDAMVFMRRNRLM